MAPSTDKNETHQLTRVRKIQIKGLFGLYDHNVELFLEDRVTILHGLNGVGKTILLKLIRAVFSQDIPFLFYVPFASLSIELANGRTITILQEQPEGVPPQRKNPLYGKLSFHITGQGELLPFEFSIDSNDLNFDEWANQYQKNLPWVHLVGAGQWHDQRTQQTYSSYELWVAASQELGERVFPAALAQLPQQYIDITNLVSTFIVEAQRLMRVTPTRRPQPWQQFGGSPLTPTVLYDAQELSAKLRDAFAQYGRVSQTLDQSFPSRLFQHDAQQISTEQIKNEIMKQEDDRKILSEYGVLDTQPQYPFQLSLLDESRPADLKAMSLYVTDTDKKLKVLREFVDRVKPLISSLNEKFKNKRIELNREIGMTAKSRSGSAIGLDQLSSGEQHEIVLLYDLLFRVAPNTLVLIDEPELSLHIEWQRQFLPELLSITKAAGFDALVATHSISIVGDRDDLMVLMKAE